MMDSDAKAKARCAEALADARAKSRDDSIKRRASMKAGADKSKTHGMHYDDHLTDHVNRRARERGEPTPKRNERSKKLREYEGPKTLKKCPDCGLLCFLVDFEHAKGGSHAGELRCSCCWRDNIITRNAYDSFNHTVYRACLFIHI